MMDSTSLQQPVVVEKFAQDKVLSLTAPQWFVIFCALHLVIWTLLPTLIYHNLPTDTLEGIAWGDLWQLGYPKHPFLAPWLTALFTNAFNTVGWPAYLLSQFAVITCFWAVWTLGNKLVSPWYSLIAVVVLEGVNFYTTESVIFNPNVLMLPLWALTTLTFYNSVTDSKQNILSWVLTGLFAGLGVITKYETVLLLAILFIFLLITPEGRKCFKKPGIYLGAIVAFLVFLPNLYWLMQHNFTPVTYTYGEMNDHKHFAKIAFLYEPFQFFVNQFLTLLPIAILSIPFYKNRYKKSSETAAPSFPRTRESTKPMDLNQFDRLFIYFVALGPFIATILFSLLTAATLISRWAFPFFSFIGLLWLMYLQPIITKKNFTQFICIVGGVFLLYIVGEVIVYRYLPYVTGKAGHSDTFPGRTIAYAFTKQWHAKYNCPLAYIAGDHHVSVNVASYSPDKPVAFFDWSQKQSPWVNKEDFKRKGAVFVLWLKYEDVPQKLEFIHKKYPGVIAQSTQIFPRQTGAKVEPVRLWVGILPPTDPACLNSALTK